MADWFERSLQYYLGELNQQAETAVDAYNVLGDLVRADGLVKPMFAAAQDVLTAAGMISKMLWPIREKVELHRERGEALRELLQVDGSSLLRSREVRDALEHFDERLDRYLSQMYSGGGPMIVVDRHYGAAGDIQLGGQPVLVLRLLDRNRPVISVLGAEVDLDLLIAAIVELNERVVNAAMEISPDSAAHWPRYISGQEASGSSETTPVAQEIEPEVAPDRPPSRTLRERGFVPSFMAEHSTSLPHDPDGAR